MVFESLLNPFIAEKKPFKVALLSFFYMSLAILLGYWIFPSQSSMVAILLVILAALPLTYRVIKLEEKKDTLIIEERKILKEHMKALEFLVVMFLGFLIATIFWYVVLPQKVIGIIFLAQTNTITEINSAITQNSLLWKIFFNNIRVLLLCVLFSLLYGVGAIFILTWNASVLGVAIGNFIRIELAKLTELVGLQKVAAYFSVISYGLLKYAIHGIPEILSYFLAGLSGGIISFAVVNKDYRKKNFKTILSDATLLFLLSIVFLFLGSIFEVYLTPFFF